MNIQCFDQYHEGKDDRCKYLWVFPCYFVSTQAHISLDTLEFYEIDVSLGSENTYLSKITFLV